MVCVGQIGFLFLAGVDGFDVGRFRVVVYRGVTFGRRVVFTGLRVVVTRRVVGGRREAGGLFVLTGSIGRCTASIQTP